ncbi:MAG: magnesium transporter, partial [Gammaproteobacteria bacterium HGW-Gammaproteobacteria-5]
LVASWYGMNFVHMPELAGPYNYYIVLGVTATACAGLFTILRRSRWL